ncbi:hypothetical protein PVAP13_2KG094016 [Panicum virgatum]|uniref:Reverse transcriptase zinc-binding domain-containing protein n=1 Tax=Panicum virgatum TaxID=38727 RepID=A0A8T0W6X2_PANVG|nr:hypothetical protein PVAP13_2KG094016 [Panicum virgatum]
MPEKPWVGMGTPCNETDKLLFAASTEIRIRDGQKIYFCESAWVAARRPKDIAPDLYSMSRRIASCMRPCQTTSGSGISQLAQTLACNIYSNLELWLALRETSLSPGTEETIRWKWTANGEYTAASAYRAQFLGSVKTDLHLLIWKPWAPPKVWTSDRLATRGCPRNDVCPLCRTEPETAHHLLVTCRFTKRVWSLIAEWLHYQQLHPSLSGITRSVSEWWHIMGELPNVSKKAVKSLLLLENWEIWKERNARTFDRREASTISLVGKIKEEARAWGIAGARHLASFVGR